MAYVAKDLSRYNRLLKPGEQPDFAVGAAGGAPAALPGAPAAPNNPQASNASGFVSFGQRLAANQGAADQMAGKVAAGAQQSANKAGSALSKVQGSFAGQVKQGSLAAPPASGAPLGGTTLSQAQGASPPPGQSAATAVPAAMVKGGSPYNRLLQPAAAAPQPPAPIGGRTIDPRGAALMSPSGAAPELGPKMLTDREKSQVAYTGPEDLRAVEGFDAAEGAALDAEDYLAATRDNAGLEGLVAQAHPGSRTAGGGALDAALTGAAGGERFAQLRRNYAGLSQKVADADRAARAQADAAKASTADAAKAYGAKADAADADQKARDDAAKAAQIASEERAAELARQAALPRQQQTAATADRRGVGDMTTTIGEERQSQMDGLWEEWLKAGRPPYEAWKASRGG